MGIISAGAKRFWGLKCWDVKAACYSPPEAAGLFFFFKGSSQRVPTVSGLVWSENKEVSILQKLRPFSFLCFATAAGAPPLAVLEAVLGGIHSSFFF